MAVAIRNGTKVWQRRDRKVQFAAWGVYLVGVAVFIYCWNLISDKTIWAFVLDAPTQAADLGARMIPPDWNSIHGLWRPIWDTLNIATLGTVMAIILAVPVAYCAARNTTPSVAFVRPLALFVIVSSRSINSLIWALMLVTIIGPGERTAEFPAMISLKRNSANSATLSSKPESTAEMGVGPSACASGSQACTGARPTFVP